MSIGKLSSFLKRVTLSMVALISGIIVCVAQNVSINSHGSMPHPSAILDINSSTKGLLIPRLTEAQKTMMTIPANGLLIYQVDAGEGFYFNKGTTVLPDWVLLGEVLPPVAFSVTGSAAVVPPQATLVCAQTQEDFDVSNNFLLSNSLVNPNSFVAPYKGIYFFSGAVIWTISPGENYYGYTEIRVNGSPKMSVYSFMHDYADLTTSLTTSLKLNAGDKVQFGIKHTSPVSISMFGSFFSGHILFKL